MARPKVKSGTTVGRPLLYTEKDFQKVTLSYLENLKGEMPTKAGLLKTLKISRETWKEYKLRPEFVYTIREVEYVIENAWVQKLVGSGATGPIFYLKNAFKEEYKDRVETDITTAGQPITGMRIVKE